MLQNSLLKTTHNIKIHIQFNCVITIHTLINHAITIYTLINRVITIYTLINHAITIPTLINNQKPFTPPKHTIHILRTMKYQFIPSSVNDIYIHILTDYKFIISHLQ